MLCWKKILIFNWLVLAPCVLSSCDLAFLAGLSLPLLCLSGCCSYQPFLNHIICIIIILSGLFKQKCRWLKAQTPNPLKACWYSTLVIINKLLLAESRDYLL